MWIPPPETITVKSRFNVSRFNAKSQFKVQNVVTKMEICIKRSQFRVKSQFKLSKRPDGGHSLNRDFTVISFMMGFSSK